MLASALSSSSQADQFRAPWRRRASSVQRSRGGVQRSRGGSSSHFERPSRAKMARCRKRFQGQCFRGQTESADRVKGLGTSKQIMQEVCVHVSVAVSLKFFIAPVSLALPYRFSFGQQPVCLASACSQFAQRFSCCDVTDRGTSEEKSCMQMLRYTRRSQK